MGAAAWEQRGSERLKSERLKSEQPKSKSERLKVAFRYCGGCNPRYDRGALVKRLTEKHQEWDAGIAAEGVHYDLLIVVGGCPSCCAAWEQFDAERVIKIWTDLEDLPAEYLQEGSPDFA